MRRILDDMKTATDASLATIVENGAETSLEVVGAAGKRQRRLRGAR